MKMKINPIIGTSLAIAIILLLQVHTSSCTNGGGSSGDSSGNGSGTPKDKRELTLSYPVRVGDKLMLRCVDKDCKVTEMHLVIPEDVPANTTLEVSVDTTARQNARP